MPTSFTDPGRPCPSTPRSARGRWRAWRARFARAFSRFLRFTTGLYVSLLFVAAAALAQDPPPREKVRFIDGKAELCEVVKGDASGVTLRLDGFPKPMAFAWTQLDPADAAALRKRLLGGAAPVPAAGGPTVAAVRVRTTDGKTVEGVVLAGAPEKELWIRNAEGRWTVPLDTILSREDVMLPAQQVYGVDELLGEMTGRRRPRTAEEADRLGAELLRKKLRERAMAAFRLGEILRHPDRTESVLFAELVRLHDLVEDLSIRRSVLLAQESWLLGDLEAVLAKIDAAEKSAGVPEGIGRELRRLRAEIQGFRGMARDERIAQEGRRSIDTLLKARAMDRTSGYEDSRAYVDSKLSGEAFEDLRRRLNFSPEDPELKAAWERRTGAPEKHSYGDGSWLVLRPEMRGPKEWWDSADDAARYAVLKGLFIEKHLQVARADLKACSACGGTGTVPAGAVCPSCLGVKSHRVVIYR